MKIMYNVKTKIAQEIRMAEKAEKENRRMQHIRNFPPVPQNLPGRPLHFPFHVL